MNPPRYPAGRTAITVAAACMAILCLPGCGAERTGAPGRPESGAASPAATPAEAPPATAAGAAAGYTAVTVEAGGTVAGRILYRGTPPASQPVQVTKDRDVCGRTSHRTESLLVGPGGGLRNAVVSIEPVPRGKPWPGGPKPVLDQRGCWFVPHVLLAPAAGEIDIVNSDGILHNIHTHSRLNVAINLAQPKYKKVMSHTFERPEPVRVVCDVHSWMNAWIVVAAHPYHALTGEDGAFTLDQVPPGSYTLRAWHETLGTREQPVTIPPGGRVEATLAFGG